MLLVLSISFEKRFQNVEQATTWENICKQVVKWLHDVPIHLFNCVSVPSPAGTLQSRTFQLSTFVLKIRNNLFVSTTFMEAQKSFPQDNQVRHQAKTNLNFLSRVLPVMSPLQTTLSKPDFRERSEFNFSSVKLSRWHRFGVARSNPCHAKPDFN